MALVTANDVGVISGRITRPLVGVWTADLVLDQPDGTGFDPGTKVTISSENGYSLAGVVDPNRTGDFLDAVHVRVIGGAGGMGQAAINRAFVQPQAFVRDVVNGLMSDSGESLSSTTDAGFLATNLAAWSVMGKPVSWNLRALLKIVAPAFSWRILADGTLWIGAESWPSATGTFDTMEQDPADGSYVLGVESPFVVPGTSIDGVGHVNRCVDVIEARRMRTHVYLDLPGEGERGLQASVARMVAQAVAGVDYYALYRFRVDAQSADLTTVDVSPVGDRNKQLLRGLQRVSVRVAAGIKVQFAAQATVLLGWDGGDPSQPYVCCGSSGDGAQSIQLAGNDAVATATDIANIKSAISGAAVVAMDGGAAFKANIIAAWPLNVGSTIVGAGR
jgi:hypothetical protein